MLNPRTSQATAAQQAQLRHSYRCCQRLARQAASNFYWSFWALPRAKRRAMYALYAFARSSDDLADSDAPLERRRTLLDGWQTALTKALAGGDVVQHPILPALVDTVQTYHIPPDYLFQTIDGVRVDLDQRGFATFSQLRDYCCQVASAIGLACIHIWGFRDERVVEPATDCGIAFQLTNILRDLTEDARRGRLYLPLDDMAAFEYWPHDLFHQIYDERFVALMRFQIQRAEQFYERAAETEQYLSTDGQRVFGVMFATYRSLLDKIKSSSGDVLHNRIRLSLPRKLSIAARHLWSF